MNFLNMMKRSVAAQEKVVEGLDHGLTNEGKAVLDQVLDSELQVGANLHLWKRILKENLVLFDGIKIPNSADLNKMIANYPFLQEVSQEELHVLMTRADFVNSLPYYVKFEGMANTYLMAYLIRTKKDLTLASNRDKIGRLYQALTIKSNELKPTNHEEATGFIESLMFFAKVLNTPIASLFSFIDQKSDLQLFRFFQEVHEQTGVVRENSSELARDLEFLKTFVRLGVKIENLSKSKFIPAMNYIVENNLDHMQKDKLVNMFIDNGEEVVNAEAVLIKDAAIAMDFVNQQPFKTAIANAFRRLIILASEHKKKGFLKQLVQLKPADLEDMLPMSMLFDATTFEKVNFNTLNPNMIKELGTTMNVRSLKQTDLTAQEYVFLNQASELHVALFDILGGLKMDERLRVLKAIPDVSGFGEKLFTEGAMRYAIERMTPAAQLGLMHFYKGYKEKGLSKEAAFKVHIFSKNYPIFSEVETNYDVDFLIKMEQDLRPTLKETKIHFVESSKDVASFREFLGASVEFFNEHLEGLLKFQEKDLFNVVRDYAKGNHTIPATNVRILAKAEIAGRLDEVKFRDADIDEELEAEVTLAQKQAWKKHLVLRSGTFTVKESSDFKTLIESGVHPTQSCMNYKSGAYRQCLLSIFDSNKKLVVVYDRGRLVGRAILRFTKVANNAVGAKALGFEDVEHSTVKKQEKKERLVIFLERLYTSYTGVQRKEFEKMMMDLVMQKAEEMHVGAAFSGGYHPPNAEEKRLYMFISHSKNGHQYLDSLGGQADSSAGGSYKHTSILLGVKEKPLTE